MGFYRKKPVVIEAIQFHQEGDHPEVVVALKDESTGAILGFSAPFSQETRAVFAIKTLEGWHEVMPGDWIICGLKGEFYPCKPDVFEATYEAECPF